MLDRTDNGVHAGIAAAQRHRLSTPPDIASLEAALGTAIHHKIFKKKMRNTNSNK
jgi:uncharacterized MnhB-related membrane protein